MEPLLIYVFRAQIELQCRAVLKATQGLADAVRELRAGGRPHLVWIEIQNLVGAAANISKALWGQEGRRANDRAVLREFLSVPDDSPLRDVAFRNNFEHYDERLDTWWATGSRNYLDNGVIPPWRTPVDATTPEDEAGITFLSEDQGELKPTDVFKMYAPEGRHAHVLGENFNLRELAQAAERLLAAIEATK